MLSQCGLSASDLCLLAHSCHKGQIFPACAHPTSYIKCHPAHCLILLIPRVVKYGCLKKSEETGQACCNALNIYQVTINFQTSGPKEESACKSPQCTSLPQNTGFHILILMRFIMHIIPQHRLHRFFIYFLRHCFLFCLVWSCHLIASSNATLSVYWKRKQIVFRVYSLLRVIMYNQILALDTSPLKLAGALLHFTAVASALVMQL